VKSCDNSGENQLYHLRPNLWVHQGATGIAINEPNW
jgi:hypothetical protein